MTSNILPFLEINSSKNPCASVIWLHGLGADGHDFVDLVPQLNLPDVRFVFPHAPVRPITLNNGFPMRAWYDIHGLNFGAREDETGVRESAKLVDQLIQQERDKGMPAEKIFLAGFSQGGAMALYCGLRYPKKLAGVLALSCYLPAAKNLVNEISDANKNIPIFMAHGIQDEIVNIKLAEYSRDCLQQLNYQIDFRIYPMAHSLCVDEVRDIAKWFKQTM